nr:uncharacterized protein LOC117988960 [Maniola hyperantus]
MSINGSLRGRRRNTSSSQRDREGVRINVREHVQQRTIRPRGRRDAQQTARMRRAGALSSSSEESIIIGRALPLRPRQRRVRWLDRELSADALRPASRGGTARGVSAPAHASYSYTQPRAGPAGDLQYTNRNVTLRRPNRRRWLQPNHFRNEGRVARLNNNGIVRRARGYGRQRQVDADGRVQHASRDGWRRNQRHQTLQKARRACRPRLPFTLSSTT